MSAHPLADLLRQARLHALAQAAAARGPLVLAGSSLGAYISARVSLALPTQALFLMAPPLTMGPLPALDAPAVPISIIHGWDDELIPAICDKDPSLIGLVDHRQSVPFVAALDAALR